MTRTQKQTDRQIKDAYILPERAYPPALAHERRGIIDGEERTALSDKVIPALEAAGVLESFADYLIVLRETLDTETPQLDGAQRVFMEIGHLLEAIFQRSEAYGLAFALYTGRFEMKGAADAAEVLRKTITATAPTLIEKEGR